jgi:hypothetical protein
MKNKKNLGIWMDHSIAHLIDINEKNSEHDIRSKFTFNTKEEALNRSENLMHNKEQQMQEAFYKKIGKEILKYNDVLLFGPTQAKTELFNFLQKDLHFKDIHFCIQSEDKMTELEQIAYVKNYFELAQK